MIQSLRPLIRTLKQIALLLSEKDHLEDRFCSLQSLIEQGQENVDTDPRHEIYNLEK